MVGEDTEASFSGQVEELAEDVAGIDAVAVGVDNVGLVFNGGGAVFEAEDGIVGVEESGHAAEALLIVGVRAPAEDAADGVAGEQVLVVVSDHGLLEEVEFLRVCPGILLSLVGEAEFGEDVIHDIPEVHVALNDLSVGLLFRDGDPFTADELDGLEFVEVVAELVGGDVVVGHEAEDGADLGAGEVHDEAFAVGRLDGENALAGADTGAEETPSESFGVLTNVGEGPADGLMLHAKEVLVVHLTGLDVDVVSGGLVKKLKITGASCFGGSESC